MWPLFTQVRTAEAGLPVRASDAEHLEAEPVRIEQFCLYLFLQYPALCGKVLTERLVA